MATGSIEALYKILYIVTLFHYLLEKVATVKLRYITVTHLEKNEKVQLAQHWSQEGGSGVKSHYCVENFIVIKQNPISPSRQRLVEIHWAVSVCYCFLCRRDGYNTLLSPPGVFPAIGNGNLVIWVV